MHRPLLSCAALNSLILVAQKCCLMVWISQLFCSGFLHCVGAVLESSDLVTVPRPRCICDLVLHSFFLCSADVLWKLE